MKPRASPSQETLVSLLELEPAPMEPTPELEAGEAGEKPLDMTGPQDHQPPRLPTDLSSSSGTSSLGLSGSGHSAVYYCMLFSNSPFQSASVLF